MGRQGNNNYKGNKGRSKEEKAKRAEEWKNSSGGDRRKTWQELQMTNENFNAFYKALEFMDDGEEFESFLTHLKQPLPACFRLNADYAYHSELANELQGYAGQEITVEDGSKVPPVQQLEWYPSKLAYKMGTDRRSIRKDAALEQLHKWLTRNTDSGNITRQEAVSMVPPLALDVQSHHKCLDMCAAPGSKTSQLLELVNSSKHSADPGLVVANDSDTDRAYMLVHQCRRINSPLLIITTHKGQAMPKIRNPDAKPATIGADGTTIGSSDYFMKNGYFDRVLADVPCSGDGTLRKNPSIWGKWNVTSSLSLHALQIMIATRGVQLLKTGGLIVYSTCSMSPYEDEACVAELLRQADGTLELVDAREFMPKFKCRPGLNTWPVIVDKSKNQLRKEAEAVEKASGEATDEMESEQKPKKEHSNPKIQKCLDLGFDHYESYDDVPGNMRSKIRKSCFPPTAAEAEWMHLERCLRCVPHDEDTGGFFVATLRKIENVTVSRKTAAPAVDEDEEKEHSSKRAAVGENREVVATSSAEPTEADPSSAKGFVDYEQWNNDAYKKAREFYGLQDTLSQDNFLVRVDSQGGKKKANSQQTQSRGVFYLPLPARMLMSCSDLKVVSAGLKVFEKKKDSQATDPSGEYRLVQEGINMLVPHMTKRVVAVTAQDMCNLLEGGLVSYSTMSDAVGAELASTSRGPVVCVYRFHPDDVIGAEKSSTTSATDISSEPICVICNVGSTRAMNVLCAKVEAERCRHQLQSLKVFREKIRSEKIVPVAEEKANEDA